MHQLFLLVSKYKWEKKDCLSKSRFLYNFDTRFSNFQGPKSCHTLSQALRNQALTTSFHERLMAREDVDSGNPAVGNRGDTGSTYLPSSSRKTYSVAISVKTKQRGILP